MNKRKDSASLKTYLQLGKFSVMIPVSLSAFTGFFLFSPSFDLRSIMVALGVLMQGLAASALNQVQEIELDAIMDRTKKRPLPTGKAKRSEALLYSLITFLIGSLLIYFGGNALAMVLGIIALLWYNGVYTPLKKRTAFAVIPGSITGAIPPVIGWVAAGGPILDKISILLAFIFFMGQIPHFWLLILKYGNQYKEAGIPSLTEIFSNRQLNNLSYIWIVAALVSALMLASFNIIQTFFLNIILIFLTITGIYTFRNLLNTTKTDGQKKYFILLNCYYLLLMILLITDKIMYLYNI